MFTEMQAALGIAQMKKLDEIISIKDEIFNFYKDNICNKKLFMRPVPISTTHPVHWFSNIHCPNSKILALYLAKENIPTRRLFYPLNQQPCFKKEDYIVNLNDNV